MINDRDTKEIVTPIGKQKVVIKEWLTGGEKRIVTNSLLKDVKLNSKENAGFEISGEAISKAQDIAFETIVVSIDGKEGDIAKRLLDMRSEDFDFVVTEVNLITNPEKDEKIKKG